MRQQKKQLNKQIWKLLQLEAFHPCCSEKDEDGVPAVRVTIYSNPEGGFDYICEGCKKVLEKVLDPC